MTMPPSACLSGANDAGPLAPAKQALAAEAGALGFDFFGAVVWFPWSAVRPFAYAWSNFPENWLQRYHDRQYAAIDPVLRWGRTSTAPLAWSDALFAQLPTLRAEAASFGLCHGWSQAVHDAVGVRGMLSLVRTAKPLLPDELQRQQIAMQALAQRAHQVLLTHIRSQLLATLGEPLTAREREVLRWSGDGKTAQDTAEILGISQATTRFHIQNAVRKLGASNTTAAVFRALALGLLHDFGIARPGHAATSKPHSDHSS